MTTFKEKKNLCSSTVFLKFALITIRMTQVKESEVAGVVEVVGLPEGLLVFRACHGGAWNVMMYPCFRDSYPQGGGGRFFKFDK